MIPPDDRDKIRAELEDGECIVPRRTLNYAGTDWPTPEQNAEMMRQLGEPGDAAGEADGT